MWTTQCRARWDTPGAQYWETEVGRLEVQWAIEEQLPQKSTAGAMAQRRVLAQHAGGPGFNSKSQEANKIQ